MRAGRDGPRPTAPSEKASGIGSPVQAKKQGPRCQSRHGWGAAQPLSPKFKKRLRGMGSPGASRRLGEGGHVPCSPKMKEWALGDGVLGAINGLGRGARVPP